MGRSVPRTDPTMYQLRVFHPDRPVAAETLRIVSAADVLRTLPRLLEEHAGCERIEVWGADVRLFSVDCDGNRL